MPQLRRLGGLVSHIFHTESENINHWAVFSHTRNCLTGISPAYWDVQPAKWQQTTFNIRQNLSLVSHDMQCIVWLSYIPTIWPMNYTPTRISSKSNHITKTSAMERDFFVDCGHLTSGILMGWVNSYQWIDTIPKVQLSIYTHINDGHPEV